MPRRKRDTSIRGTPSIPGQNYPASLATLRDGAANMPLSQLHVYVGAEEGRWRILAVHFLGPELEKLWTSGPVRMSNSDRIKTYGSLDPLYRDVKDVAGEDAECLLHLP